MTKSSVFAALMALAVLAGTNMAQEKKAEGKKKKGKKFAAKCVVAGRAAKEDKVVAYKNGDVEGKVYVCCGNCLAKLEKSVKDKTVDTKIANKANAQLVQTGQYVQAKCPISGGKFDKTKTVKVGARKVKFCCGKCVAKVEAEKDKDKQLALVYSADAFKKGFGKKKAKGKKGKKKKKDAA